MQENFTLPLNTLPFDTDSVRIRRGSFIPPGLKSYECFFNWAKLYPLKYSELGYGLLLLEEKFKDETKDVLSLLTRGRSTSSSSIGILFIAKKLIQAFLNIELTKFLEAEECLRESEKFLGIWSSPGTGEEDTTTESRTLFCQDYLDGFYYVLEGTQVFLQIQICCTPVQSPKSPGTAVFPMTRRKESLNTEKVVVQGLKSFKRLSPKAKFIVWTVRDVFYAHCVRCNVERTDWIEDILEMEPYIPKWHFYLYRALHSARKLVPRPAPVLLLPLETEKWRKDQDPDDEHDMDDNDDIMGNHLNREERILNVNNMIVGSGLGLATAEREGISFEDPLSISYRAMCLAQLFMEKRGTTVRVAKQNDDDGNHNGHQNKSEKDRYCPPWRFGKMFFDEPVQVLQAIQKLTRQVIEMDCHLDGVYLNFSEVHMFILPPEDRNLEMAIRCLKKALRLNNTNPRTHHRMGLAYFKLRNHKQATFHFREAIKSPTNIIIGAIFGLLQLLMSSPSENDVEIHSIFHRSLTSPSLTKTWDRQCLRILHFLKGCFHFMLPPPQPQPHHHPASAIPVTESPDLALHEEALTSWIIAHDNESHKWSYFFHNLPNQCSRFDWPTKRLNLGNVSNALKHAAYLERTQFRQLLLEICFEVDDAIHKNEARKNSSLPYEPMLQTHSNFDST